MRFRDGYEATSDERYHLAQLSQSEITEADIAAAGIPRVEVAAWFWSLGRIATRGSWDDLCGLIRKLGFIPPVTVAVCAIHQFNRERRDAAYRAEVEEAQRARERSDAAPCPADVPGDRGVQESIRPGDTGSSEAPRDEFWDF